MNRVITVFIAAFLGLTIPTTLQAGLYKWTDEKGNVHYSQRPPPNTQYEKMKVDKGPPPSSINTETSADGNGQSTDGKASPKSQALDSELAKNREMRRRNCQAAKQNLRAYSVYRRVKDETGKVRLVPQAEREEKIKQAEAAVAEFCD